VHTCCAILLSMFKATQSKKEQEADKEKTLDLLDELLYSIHSTRAHVLEARARKYEKRLAKRAEKSSKGSRRNRGSFVDETEADLEVDNLLDEMAEEFNVPANQPPAPAKAGRLGSRGSKPGAPAPGQGQAAQALLSGLSISKSATYIAPEPAISLKSAATAVASMAGGGQGGGGVSKSDAAITNAKGKKGFKPTKIFQSSNQGFLSNEDR